MKDYIEVIHKSLTNKELIKLQLINSKNSALEYTQIIIKPVVLKNGPQLSFVYRYPTKDVTKNFNHTKSILLVKEALKNDFVQSIAYTKTQDYHFVVFPNGKTKIKKTQPSLQQSNTQSHDNQKARLINTKDKPYLTALGVSSSNGLVKSQMQGKYRQINKFIEIINNFKPELSSLSSISVADMGSGKGYLSFALYDYLTNQLAKETTFEAIELRKNLVDKGNDIAAQSGFKHLKFIESDISQYDTKQLDLLIALHACDTATDEAIQKGINAGAKLIVCSPCCHKQIRKEINDNSAVRSILKYGILKERQAEIVTDTIRALILEYFGYRTNVMEFISSEHTSKNLLITAVKDEKINLKSASVKKKIDDLKSLFGIGVHRLEELMLLNGGK